MKEHNASGPGPGWHPNASAPVPAMSTERLLPALLECFGIILCGYVTGRAKVITSSQAKALGSFVSLFALPALLYKNMVLLDFSHVIWPFLWSILVAKVSVFAIVCVLTMLVASPESRLSKAGLFSIFATQSNDFALGYPIVEALYQSSHPEYLQYIYLVAPISLVLLNPLGFALCEVQRWRSGQDRRQGGLRTAGTVVLRVLRNPVVFMVAVGLASRFTLGRRVPDFLSEFVDALASAFGGTALFYLGLCMVGQLRKLTGSTGTALILLITAKLLVMPLICRDMVELLDMGNTSSINHSSLSNYAFLYGTFPTAPSVAIYAAHYSMELEVVTSGMVISTFLSAPIMYVSAWLMTIPWMDTKPLATALQNISFNISIVSLVALVWTMAVTLLSKKFKKLPHMFTLNLFTAQFLACIGMILWNFIVKEDNFVGQVLTFILLYGSLYSTYVWTGLVAFSLALMSKDDELKVPPGIFFLIGWGVPALIVGTLLIAGDKMTNTIDSAFFYGNPQVISTAVVLACSILLGGASLMALSRGFRTLDYQVLEPEDQQPHSDPEIPTSCEPVPEENLFDRDCHLCDCAQPRPQTIPGTNMNDTSSLPAGQCQEPCESYYCLLAQEDRRQLESDQQVAQHVLLCLLLIVILLANVSSCLWWLFNNVPGRLYLELQFFCAIANYGQGFISFGIFGLDKHLIILPFKKRLVALWQSRKQAEQEEVPSAVPEEIRLTCTQFVRYHKDQCVQDIVQMRRCGVRSLKATFLGSELVDWLLRVGLAHDRGEATLYGASLLQGAVLQHVTQEFDFLDDDLHYLFTTEGGDAER